MTSSSNEIEQMLATPPANWVGRATLLWKYRRTLVRVTAVALVVSLGIAFVIP
jgi:hypothetical protein